MAGSFKWKVAQKAEKIWWRRYLGNRPVEEYLKWKYAYWEKFMKTIEVYPSKDSAILDAGCGPAGIFIFLSGKHKKLEALDPLLDQYDKEIPHFKRSAYPDVLFYSDQLENFAPKHRYNWIFCLNVINHVDDIGRSLENLYQLLEPGGKIVLSVDAHNSDFLKKMFQILPGDILHPQQLNLNDYESKLKQVGFKPINLKTLRRSLIFSYHVLIAEKN